MMTGINKDLLGKMYLFVLCDINLDLDIFIDKENLWTLYQALIVPKKLQKVYIISWWYTTEQLMFELFLVLKYYVTHTIMLSN